MRTTWKLFSNTTNLIFLLSLTFLFLFSGSAFVYAKPLPFPEAIPSALINSETLKCSFPEGVFTKGQDGKFSTEPSEGMSDIVFDSIDIKQGKARMIGNDYASDVTVEFHPSGVIHFTVTTAGTDRGTISIFSKLVKGKTKILAVYSRLSSLLWFFQYYGTCEQF